MREDRALWLVLGLLLLGGGGVVIYNQTRGLRNNNPGNIRRTPVNDLGGPDPWQGLAPQQTDVSFFQFVSAAYGIRAMAIILRGYRNNGRNTISKIITRWAPASENDVAAYVQDVSSYSGIDPDAPLADSDMPMVVAGIIKHENGLQPYAMATITQGFDLGGVAYA